MRSQGLRTMNILVGFLLKLALFPYHKSHGSSPESCIKRRYKQTGYKAKLIVHIGLFIGKFVITKLLISCNCSTASWRWCLEFLGNGLLYNATWRLPSNTAFPGDSQDTLLEKFKFSNGKPVFWVSLPTSKAASRRPCRGGRHNLWETCRELQRGRVKLFLEASRSVSESKTKCLMHDTTHDARILAVPIDYRY